MNKINFTLEINEQMLDDATIQILKGKIREMVASEVDKQAKVIIQQAVKTQVENYTRAFEKGMNSWGWSDCRKALFSKINDQIVEMKISPGTVKEAVEDVLSPVRTYAAEARRSVDAYIKELERYVSNNVDSGIEKYIKETVQNSLMAQLAKSLFGDNNKKE